MGQVPFILQIVGYQNSGKTTLLEKLIRAAVHEKLRVGTIKHHGHGGYPAADERKDSFRHREAGALVTSVEGDGMLQLHAKQDSWPLADILKLYENLMLDAVFIEGYKKEPYEKAVLVRKEEDIKLINTLTNVICIISWIPLDEEVRRKYKVFYLKEDKDYVTWLLERMRNNYE